MKIYITGTTKGLGATMAASWAGQHEVIGLNRPEYNLDKDIKSYVKTDFDVYINNAYYNFAQTNLLYDLYEANKHRKCQIINIGSVSSDTERDAINPYVVHKLALDRACMQLQLQDTDCKVILVKMGRMDTPLVAHRVGYPKIATQHIVEYLNWIIHQPDNMLIKNLTIDQLHSNRMVA
jgi:short-subunit dehydrogenase